MSDRGWDNGWEEQEQRTAVAAREQARRSSWRTSRATGAGPFILPREIDQSRPAGVDRAFQSVMLAAFLVAFSVALTLAYFAKSVLVRSVPHTSESTSYASTSGLSLDQQREYQDQLLRKRKQGQPSSDNNTSSQDKPKSVMQPPSGDLAPPKDDPFTVEQLKAFDGSDPSKPIYVAIKGVHLFLATPRILTYVRLLPSSCRHCLRRHP